MFQGRFATAITCIDGRVQMPVIRYMKNRFSLDYVDIVSEPGANLVLAEETSHLVDDILRKVRTSIDRHGSHLVAVVGHHDCAGNPAPCDEQTGHTRHALARLESEYHEDMRYVGLWVNARWNVVEVAWLPQSCNWTPPRARR